MKNRLLMVALPFLFGLLTAACAADPTPTPEPTATAPPISTSTPTPTSTPRPAPVPTPTPTAPPTATPTPTPPAEALAFTLEQDGQWDLYTSDTEGGRIVRLTDTPQREVRPQWSPDGSQIAFAHFWSGSGPQSEAGLFLINHDGTGRQQIVDRGVLSWSWSPDSNRLAYTAVDSGDAFCGDFPPWSAHIVDVATGRELAVVPGRPIFPVWSPDGDGLFHAVLNFGPDGPVYVVQFLSITGEVRETDVKLLPLASSAAGGQMFWGGTGEGITSLSQRPGPRWVWASDAEGSDPRKIAELTTEDNLDPFTGFPFVTLVDPSLSDELLSCAGAYAWYQRAFSPDGSKFAFVNMKADQDDFGEMLQLSIIDPFAGEASVTSFSFRSLIDDWDRIEARTESYELEDALVDLNWSGDSTRLFYSVADPVGTCCRLSSHWRFFWYRPADGSGAEILANVGPGQKAWLACCGLASLALPSISLPTPGPTATPTPAFDPTPTPTFTPTPAPGTPGGIAAPGDMAVGRGWHAAVLLDDGRLLVTGGLGVNFPLSSAELFDPSTRAWEPAASMRNARGFHTATKLTDGSVLVAGGLGRSGTLGSAETYDPRTGSWTSVGDLMDARAGHTATLLADGRVLIVGGTGVETEAILASAEVYDPASRSWARTQGMTEGRFGHSATLLSDGRVLVVGGESAEVYAPATGTWSQVGDMATTRYEHAATLLPDGRVLVIGGLIRTIRLATAEVYTPSTNSWSTVPEMFHPRNRHAAVLLKDGRVLAVDGLGFDAIETEFYDPFANTWTLTGPMAIHRELPTVTLLDDGTVLVVGGFDESSGPLASTELYDPTTESWTSSLVATPPPQPAGTPTPTAASAPATPTPTPAPSTPTPTPNPARAPAPSQTPVDVSGLTSGVAAVSAGFLHTCALTTAGGLKCWGRNDSGQLGDGTTTQRTTPVDVIGLTDGVAAVSAGVAHTCALTTAGALKCWGSNGSGQVGDGTTTQRTTPVDVIGLTDGVAAVSAGVEHTCALTTAGALKCWGTNRSGQLGDGTTMYRITPMDVVGLTSGVAAVSPGDRHTCALTTAGGAKCWGSNLSGQLGDGTTTDRTTPVDVIGLTDGVADVSVGSGHTCALTTAGGLKCWGRNDLGQLGATANSPSNTPVDVIGFLSVVPELDPSLSQWGLAVLALAFAATAYVSMRRRPVGKTD